ncbi:MAG: hypothetical protein ACHQF3_11380, partial [Alphaproteobacteria bacterium]
SKAILAFSAASIFRLVLCVMIRSIYHDGTAHAPTNPLVPNPGSTSDRALALFDPLLRRAAMIVEGHDAQGNRRAA